MSSLPLFTHFEGIVLKQIWFPPEVLPVMSINTLSFVVFLVVGTPFSFKIEHVEFLVACHFVNKWSFNVLICVRKAAELFVLAFLSALSAKLSFVLFNMV